MAKQYVLKIITGILSSLLFVSCLSIEQEVELEGDGSGMLTLTYLYGEDFARFGTLDDADIDYPLPLAEPDFRKGAAAVDGVDFISFSSRIDGDVHTVKGSVRFASVGALSSFLFPMGGGEVALAESDGRTTLRFLIRAGTDGQADADTAGMIRHFLADETLSLSVTAPARSITAEGGTVDGKTVRFTIPVSELTLMTEDLVWDAAWR